MSNHRHPRYTPLDHILESPTTRILRRLRWFDEAEVGDLLDAAGYSVEDSLQRNNATKALSRLVAAGHVAARAVRAKQSRGNRTLTLYRITQSGREELARRLRPDTSVCSDREAAPCV